jgi:hypothetical protein
VRGVKAHYIKPNEQAKVPSRIVVFDTESNRDRTEKGECQTWSLAVAMFLEWNRQGSLTETLMTFDTPMELWQAISQFTRPTKRTVVYAHNLNYDLRISNALSLLPKLEFQLRDIRLDGRGSWSKWSRAKATLTLCDSASIFPCSLDVLAKTLGMRKLPLPKSTDRARLLQRCKRDVQVLSKAIICYVSWMRSGMLGNWQMTGASQAWSHWRHSHYTHKVLIHDNSEALAAERAAMHAGRCEAWQWGEKSGDVWYEYDWANSYPRIARDHALPARLCGTINRPNPSSMPALISKYCVLAELEIDTRSACVPTSYGDRVIWPVGQFTSTLWDPEIRLLQESGATFRVRRAWLYTRQPVLKDWAEWILSSLHDTGEIMEPWQKLILKHWSRALIGRFGMRYKAWEMFATTPQPNVTISELYNSDTKQLSQLMQVGTTVYVSGEQKEIEDGCPQITGYIMSVARAKLWRVTQDIGANHVLYMDTDSLVVDSAGAKSIQAAGNIGDYDGLRSKARYRSLHLYGPRSVILDRKPTVSGLPRNSNQTGPATWTGEVWRGVTESIRQGEWDRVTIRSTDFQLRYNMHRRHFLSGGGTVPYRLPDYVPTERDVSRETQFEKAVTNGYPSVLAHHPSAKRRNRPVSKE